MDENLKKRLLKLVELARRGVGGEKEAAEAALERVLAAAGISRAELERLQGVGDRKWRLFRYEGELEEILLKQTAFMVLEPENGHISTSRLPQQDDDGEIFLQVSDAEYIEISVAFSVFKKALKDEIKITFDAFLHKNEIFSKRESNAERRELTDDEKKNMASMVLRMHTMDRVNVRKQIGEKE